MDLLPALLRRWKIRMGISERSVVDFLPGKPLFKSHRKLWVSWGASNIQLKGCILPGVEQEQCHCLRVSYMSEMLTGWILKAAFVVIFSTSQERSPNIQVVLWLAQGHVSGIQTQPWLRLYRSTSRDHPRGSLLPWASVPGDCQIRWLGAPQFIRPPGFESWSLFVCWASNFTALNLNFLIYQMGIILVIILQRAMRSIHLTWHSTEHIASAKKITIIINRWLLLAHAHTDFQFPSKILPPQKCLTICNELASPSGKSDYIPDCACHISHSCVAY